MPGTAWCGGAFSQYFDKSWQQKEIGKEDWEKCERKSMMQGGVCRLHCGNVNLKGFQHLSSWLKLSQSSCQWWQICHWLCISAKQFRHCLASLDAVGDKLFCKGGEKLSSKLCPSNLQQEIHVKPFSFFSFFFFLSVHSSFLKVLFVSLQFVSLDIFQFSMLLIKNYITQVCDLSELECNSYFCQLFRSQHPRSYNLENFACLCIPLMIFCKRRAVESINRSFN